MSITGLNILVPQHSNNVNQPRPSLVIYWLWYCSQFMETNETTLIIWESFPSTDLSTSEILLHCVDVEKCEAGRIFILGESTVWWTSDLALPYPCTFLQWIITLAFVSNPKCCASDAKNSSKCSSSKCYRILAAAAFDCPSLPKQTLT